MRDLQTPLLVVVSLLLCIASLSTGETARATNKDLTLENWQKIILDEFRVRMMDIVPHEYMKDEIYLVRWLRARNWDIDAATRMLIKNLEWRKANKIDTILDEDWSEFERNYPIRLDSLPRDGKPIVICDFGPWDIRALALTGRLPELVRYITKILEEASTTVRQDQHNGKNVSQFEILVDMDKYSIMRHGCFQCIPYYVGATTVFDSYYPGVVDNFIIINTPPAFEIPFRSMIPVMSMMTRSTFHIIGRNRPLWESDTRFEVINPNIFLPETVYNFITKKE